MGNTTIFKIRTGIPKGRNVWHTDAGAKVQAGLFAAVAVIVADNPEAEAKLMEMIADAKAEKKTYPVAV